MSAQSQLDQPPFETSHQDAFLVIGEDGSVRSMSAQAEHLIGLPAEIVVGINAFTFFHVDDVPILMSIISEAMMRPRESRAVELRIRREGDSWRPITLSASNDATRPEAGGIAFRLHGPDASVQAADQIVRLALHDRITDLPNCALFIDRIDHALLRAERRTQSVIVMVAGFNGYGAALSPDSLEAGDELVVGVARRLRSCLRASDSVSRIKHDEFGILLEDVSDVSHVKVVADRIIRAMEVPFFDGGSERIVAPAIGVAISAADRKRAVELLRAASIARAWASVQGSGGYALYDPTMAAPEGEDSTSQFEFTAPETPELQQFSLHSADDGISELQQRIAQLEQMVAGLSMPGVVRRG